jgi:hypothetical protein
MLKDAPLAGRLLTPLGGNSASKLGIDTRTLDQPSTGLAGAFGAGTVTRRLN